MPWKLGTALTAQDQPRVLVKYERPPDLYSDDRDWLARTHFRTNGHGRLDGRARYCMSSWPLRQEAAE